MVLKASIFSLLWMSVINAQTDINYSYEMKYGDGKQVTPLTQDTTDYSYFENLLDINTYYGNKIYIYSQLEYSNPPVYGNNRTSIDSILNTFYIEYSSDRYNIKLGDLYELYGRGLGFYTLQEQAIDYDNSIKGFALNYSLKNNLVFSSVIGRGDYAYRSNAAFRQTDYQINNYIILGSVDYESNSLGYLQFLYLKQTTYLIYDFIKELRGDGSKIGNELAGRTVITDFLSSEGDNDTLFIENINLNWNNYLGPIEVYIDKAWINYEKIYGDQVFGSRFYTSIYTELFETGITYEYKNYHTPYLINTISNPPLVYRESNSVLASRNSHTFNFGNEIGHQVDFNKNFFKNINVLGNFSFSYRRQKEGMVDLSILDFLTMSENSEIYAYYPFRQMYLEMNGWSLSERLYYKVGVDYFSELNFLNSGKNTYAFTMPTHWVWKFENGSSVTTYLEIQLKTEKQLDQDFAIANEKNYINQYMSFSYNHFGKWTLTGFYDREVVNDKVHQWPGLDFSFYLNSESQISLFYGSQKGGLVCANGICAEQPGFEDGVKITFRSLF